MKSNLSRREEQRHGPVVVEIWDGVDGVADCGPLLTTVCVLSRFCGGSAQPLFAFGHWSLVCPTIPSVSSLTFSFFSFLAAFCGASRRWRWRWRRRPPLLQIFSWLVGKINEAHASAPGSNGAAAAAETVAFVGILDIFGKLKVKVGRGVPTTVRGFCPRFVFFLLFEVNVFHPFLSSPRWSWSLL